MNLDDLRARIGAQEDEVRAKIGTLDSELRGLHQDDKEEIRELTPADQATFDEKFAQREKLVKVLAGDEPGDGAFAELTTNRALLVRHETIEKAASVPERIERTAPNVIMHRDAVAVLEDRSATSTQLADAATRALEGKVESAENMAHVRKILKRHAPDREWARGILARSTEAYATAWAKIVSGREHTLTNEERTVLGVTTNANGKFLLPTHLDPTIILTNAGTSNVIRGMARVVTLTDGQAAWNGVTSAGVTASWDGEVVEVSDDSPTFAQPSIPTFRAQALAQASISATEDISGLATDLLMLFADARDRLEGAAHATGNGTTQPKGIFTALNADTNVQVTSTTAATIGVVDLHAVYKAVPVRWRSNGEWLMNPLYSLAIKALGTAVSASYSGDLTQPVAGRLLGHELVESDDAPTTQTTTALDNELIFGDFSQYVIVDRPGDMAVEYIPHLFNTANNLPDGRRGWYATWRSGADVTTTSPFRMLVDKTTA